MQETVNQENGNVTVDQNAGNEQAVATPKTFTQDEVNAIIKKRFPDYKTLEQKAKKFDELEEASKSELQKATEKVTQLENELNGMKKAQEISGIRSAVAKELGIPSELLTADTKEDCEAQAKALLAFAGKKTYPSVRDSGEVSGQIKRSTRQQFADWLNQAT